MSDPAISIPANTVRSLRRALARGASWLFNLRVWGPDGDRAWWLIAAFGVVIVAGAWTLLALNLVAGRQALLDAASREVEAVAGNFEQRTLRTIRNADATTLALKDQYEQHRTVDIDHALARGIIPSDTYLVVSIADAQGTIVQSSDPRALGVQVGDREHFKRHAASDTDALDIGRPIVLKTTGHAAIALSRRLNGADGSFAGIVFLSVDPDFFTDFYSEAALGSSGTLGLLGTDGVYRARRSGVAHAEAPQSRGSSGVLDHAKNGATAGTFDAISPFDGVSRLVAYRKVRDLPLYVVVTKTMQEVLAGFREKQALYYWIGGAASFLLFTFFAVVSALAWSLKQSRERAWSRARDLALASKVYESTADGIIITDADDRIIMVNAAFSKLTGFSPDDVLGLVLAQSPFRPIDPVESAARSEQMLRDGHVTGEVTRLHKDGTELALWVTATAVCDDAGRMENCVRVFTDISVIKASRRQLETMASHDALTGLPNRRAFHERMPKACAAATREARGLALLYIDLDRFKQTNDRFGHETGDALLLHVVGILAAAVRTNDTAFRIGGDEFIVILEDGADIAVAQIVASRIIEALKSLVIVNGHAVVTGASVGIALYPIHAQSADALLRCADAAMYVAKTCGRNRFATFGASAPPQMATIDAHAP